MPFLWLWFLGSVCLAEDIPVGDEEAKIEADRQEVTQFLDQYCGKKCKPAKDQEVRHFFKVELSNAKQEAPKSRYKKYRSRK
jgi:hypothetical protein